MKTAEYNKFEFLSLKLKNIVIFIYYIIFKKNHEFVILNKLKNHTSKIHWHNRRIRLRNVKFNVSFLLVVVFFVVV